MIPLKIFWDKIMMGKKELLQGWIATIIEAYGWFISVAAMPSIILALSIGTVYSDFIMGIALMGYFVWIGILACAIAVPFAGWVVLIFLLLPGFLNDGALGVFGLSFADWPVVLFFWVAVAAGIVGNLLLTTLFFKGVFGQNQGIVHPGSNGPLPYF
jgi:MFS family permease